jgi:hypothetical protein
MTSEPTVANSTFVIFSVCDKGCNAIGCSLTVSRVFSSEGLGVPVDSCVFNFGWWKFHVTSFHAGPL